MKPGKRLMMWLLPHVFTENGEGVMHRMCRTNFLLRYDESEGDGEFVDIISLVALNQGQGDGTQALRMLTGMADLFGVKLTLFARAMDHKPHSTKRLVEWYERHGFQAEGGVTWRPYSDPDPNEVDEGHHGLDMWRPVST